MANGLVDKLEILGIPVFGPTKMAAEIEWSKTFAKQFMKEEGIPTAMYEVFDDLEKAKSYIKTRSFPLVIKASGLALGKGVTIANSINEARETLDEIMLTKVFGKAGDEVIIEEYLYGKEISIHAFCDGINTILFPPAQDHKRIFDGDKGPNTGGMGTIVPVPYVTQGQMQIIKEKVIIPTISALKRRGRPFKGILFPGIMLTKSGPKVIEFNARFGDPETQSYMRILETDIVEILISCINGNLKEQKITWLPRSACCIVCASSGYPKEYQKGKTIGGLDNIQNDDIVIFHAGTKPDKNRIITNGGRVLGVTATGENIQESLVDAYKALELISFEGIQYRRDIGQTITDCP